MISGLPVIGANAGGVKDTVKHRINGFLFKAREVEELTNSMLELIENENFRNNLRINGRKTALERCWNRVFEGLENIYSDVIYNQKHDFNITS